MIVCRESGVEDIDDLYPGKKPGQEQNFEIHPPRGPISVFSFPHLLTDMATSMVIRRQMCSVCPYLVFPNLVVNMCKKQRRNAISNRALKVDVLKRVSG